MKESRSMTENAELGYCSRFLLIKADDSCADDKAGLNFPAVENINENALVIF